MIQPTEPFSLMQNLVARLVGRGESYGQVATRLSIGKATVKMHAECASRKLPGVLSPQIKLICWFQGATNDDLTSCHTIIDVVAMAVRGRRDELLPVGSHELVEEMAYGQGQGGRPFT